VQKAVTTSNIPTPDTRSTVTSCGTAISPTETLRAMKPGDSFVVDTRRGRSIVTSAAYRLEINIRTAKEGTRFRVWRTS